VAASDPSMAKPLRQPSRARRRAAQETPAEMTADQGFELHPGEDIKRKTQTREESVFDVLVQELKNIRFPFGDAKVEQTVPIL